MNKIRLSCWRQLRVGCAFTAPVIKRIILFISAYIIICLTYYIPVTRTCNNPSYSPDVYLDPVFVVTPYPEQWYLPVPYKSLICSDYLWRLNHTVHQAFSPFGFIDHFFFGGEPAGRLYCDKETADKYYSETPSIQTAERIIHVTLCCLSITAIYVYMLLLLLFSRRKNLENQLVLIIPVLLSGAFCLLTQCVAIDRWRGGFDSGFSYYFFFFSWGIVWGIIFWGLNSLLYAFHMNFPFSQER